MPLRARSKPTRPLRRRHRRPLRRTASCDVWTSPAVVFALWRLATLGHAASAVEVCQGAIALAVVAAVAASAHTSPLLCRCISSIAALACVAHLGWLHCALAFAAAYAWPTFPPKKSEASLLADLERHHAWALAHVETLRERTGDLFRTRLRQNKSSDEREIRLWHYKHGETARMYPACASMLDQLDALGRPSEAHAPGAAPGAS